MANVLIVAYLLIVLALIAVILLQRSEGGGLGMGSSNANGLISVRGSANLLTRTTAILAALFFASAIGLTILSSVDRGTSSILDRASEGGDAAPTTVLDALQQLQQQSSGDLPVPADTTTAPATSTAPATTTTPSTTTEAPAAGSDLPVPAETAPAAETPAAPATTEQPAAPAN
jgi:preprotein translocase subunit SecG